MALDAHPIAAGASHGVSEQRALSVVGQVSPATCPTPVIDKDLHSAAVVAADDAAIDSFRDCSDQLQLIEQSRAKTIRAVQPCSSNADGGGGVYSGWTLRSVACLEV